MKGTVRKTLGLMIGLAALGTAVETSAHHGFGRFDRANDAIISGTITDIDFVNPHAYLYFDQVTASGEVIEMRCEMRAATLMRRSGWTREMFATGAKVTIYGFMHREDPGSCYVEDITIGDTISLNRNDQIELPKVDTSNRPYRLPNGQVNLNGDWAQEQYVVARPPSGAMIGLVPASMKPGIEAGTIDPAEVPNSGWGPRPVTLTTRGQQEADAFVQWSVEDNPRLRCRPTSIIFDWVFDGPVNRIAQEDDRIIIDYGLYSFQRVIRMDMDAHPANITPSYSGHSIGHWEGDTLVVDTVGFEPGVMATPVRHSGQLRIVERYNLDPETFLLKREFVATDPVYWEGEYKGDDVVMLSSVPFEAHACDELTFEFGGKKPN